MATLIDGKLVSEKLREDIAKRVSRLADSGIPAGLAVVLVGNDPASCVYVKNKKKACEQVGITSFEYDLSEDTTQEALLSLIGELNGRDDVDGILVQLPLPKGLDAQEVIAAIDPAKDVDAFSPVNVGNTVIGTDGFFPCTPAGIMELLKFYGITAAGRECVIVGRSNIVGKPMALLMLHADATVTVCHSKTRDLADVCRRADILIVAVGRAKFITADMIKDGAVVIDVGMNRDENGRLCGDVDFESANKKASFITPVPGGVGPMTITMLLANTVKAAERKKGLA